MRRGSSLETFSAWRLFELKVCRGPVVTQAAGRVLLLGGDHSDSLLASLAGYDALLLLSFPHSRPPCSEAGPGLVVYPDGTEGALDKHRTFKGNVSAASQRHSWGR